MLLIII